MRILSIHSDRVWYRATDRTRMAESIGKKYDDMDECVVLFCCVEKLDEKNPARVIASATANILSRLEKLKVRKVMIYPYAHLASTLGSPQCALDILKGLELSLKALSIEVKRAPFGWYKEFMIHGKGHPLADLSMTICPYEGNECDFHCPYCKNPLREVDMNNPGIPTGNGTREDSGVARIPGAGRI